jgi:hypothetical protein
MKSGSVYVLERHTGWVSKVWEEIKCTMRQGAEGSGKTNASGWHGAEIEEEGERLNIEERRDREIREEDACRGEER